MNFVSHNLIHGFLREADILIILKFHKLFVLKTSEENNYLYKNLI